MNINSQKNTLIAGDDGVGWRIAEKVSKQSGMLQ
jgi:hypothetical protein